MDIYKLYRNFWDYAFDNPEKIKPNHVAIYSFAIEHCNRLGWKQKFGFPTSMVLEATGIKSYSVYKKTFDDLVKYGFINVIEYSKNQYSSNIIALKENNKANDKALNKALTKHTSKQSESTHQSTDSIDKQIYNSTNKQVYNIEERKLKFAETLKDYLDLYGKDMMNDFFKYWTEPNSTNSKLKFELQKTWSVKLRLERWSKNNNNFKNLNNGNKQQTADERLQEAKSRILGEDSEFSESKPNNEDIEFTSFENVGSF